MRFLRSLPTSVETRIECHETKDVMHPQAFLGHKRSDNSDLFTQIEQRSFQDIGDPSKYCTTSKEEIRLGERLFRPFGIIEGAHLYRKRK